MMEELASSALDSNFDVAQAASGLLSSKVAVSYRDDESPASLVIIIPRCGNLI